MEKAWERGKDFGPSSSILVKHDLDMSTSNDGLVVRKANSYDDLKFLSELLDKEADCAMGQNELRCAFSCDPSGFFVGELGGKMIS